MSSNYTAAAAAAAHSSNSNNNAIFEDFEQKSYIETQKSGVRIYKLQINVADFRAEDLKIQIDCFNLSISGYYASDQFVPKSMRKTKQFKRDIELPSFVDLSRMRSYLIPSDEQHQQEKQSNILIIEAPVLTSSATTPRMPHPPTPSQSAFIHNNNNNTNLQSPRNIQERLNTVPAGPLDSNEISSGILKYKFSLKEYRPQDISICIKDGKKLLINAINESHDHYGRLSREFVREINLPQNVDPLKIKNCYDPIEGILRIEIPLSNLNSNQLETAASGTHVDNNSNYSTYNGTTSSTSGALTKTEEKFEKMNLNEDHLELAFDLTDYELSNVKIVQQNSNKSKILQLVAIKKIDDHHHVLNDDHSDAFKEDLEKKVSYLLPNWVDTNNYRVYKKALESSNSSSNNRNIIVIKLPILKQFLANNYTNTTNTPATIGNGIYFEKNCV